MGFTGYFGFIRSHSTSEFKMFLKIIKIQCIRMLQQMATDFSRIMQSPAKYLIAAVIKKLIPKKSFLIKMT